MSKITRKFSLWALSFYQKYLSILSFGSCRYYPSCSEFARWQFAHNSFLKAFFASLVRILKCNPYFSGGIDYPLIRGGFKTELWAFKSINEIKIKFWFVPDRFGRFYIIKAIFAPIKTKENSC